MLIEINKRIPLGAGMGGGSSDAAAVLRALNRLYGDVLDREQLRCLSERIGSDVPFCVYGGTALASGRGEKLEALPGYAGLPLHYMQARIFYIHSGAFQKA